VIRLKNYKAKATWDYERIPEKNPGQHR
jgi:hypothetical protein